MQSDSKRPPSRGLKTAERARGIHGQDGQIVLETFIRVFSPIHRLYTHHPLGQRISTEPHSHPHFYRRKKCCTRGRRNYSRISPTLVHTPSAAPRNGSNQTSRQFSRTRPVKWRTPKRCSRADRQGRPSSIHIVPHGTFSLQPPSNHPQEGSPKKISTTPSQSDSSIDAYPMFRPARPPHTGSGPPPAHRNQGSRFAGRDCGFRAPTGCGRSIEYNAGRPQSSQVPVLARVRELAH